VPSGAIEDEDGMGTGCDALADLGQVQAHQFGVDGWQHEGCSNGPCRADGAEDIGPVMALIARRRRPGAAACPDPRQRPLLTNPGFIPRVKPEGRLWNQTSRGLPQAAAGSRSLTPETKFF
jgi:hypothetical protein